MATPEEDQIRQASQDAKTRTGTALDQAAAAGRQATEAAQRNIAAQQTEAANRLLADARKRGYAGGADTFTSGLSGGGADRRIQSLSEGQGARDRDYAARRSITDELYGRMESLAPLLGQQLADARALAAAEAAARGGGGGSGGSAGGWSVQDDIFDQLLDRITQDDTDTTTASLERLYDNLGRLSPRLQSWGQDFLDSSGSNPAKALEKISELSDRDAYVLLAGNGNQDDAIRNLSPRAMARTLQERDALRRAYQDAVRNPRTVRTSTTARRQQTRRSQTNSRSRSRSSSPHRGFWEGLR